MPIARQPLTLLLIAGQGVSKPLLLLLLRQPLTLLLLLLLIAGQGVSKALATEPIPWSPTTAPPYAYSKAPLSKA